MKILLTNAFLGGKTGSETWVETMATELGKEHQVYKWTPGNEIPECEIAIINHNICLNKLKDLPIKKIFTSHGVIPDLEQPVQGADMYVSVSEEVQENLQTQGYESIIIRNGIDCDKFKSIQPVNQQLKNVLFSSNYPSKIEDKIFIVCEELGLNFRRIGAKNSTSEVVEAINEADLVIGLGRTAYEAMACERNVIIYDYNGADGYCTPETLLEYRKNNCSGRRYKKDYSIEDIKKELLKYNPTIGKELREYILQNNNIKLTSKQYLQWKKI